MRTIGVLAAVSLVLGAPRDARACAPVTYEQHLLDRAQLADSVKPGPVALGMWIEQQGDGGCATRETQCAPSGRQLVVHVTASDDHTPPDKLGYRVTIPSGRAPFATPGDIRPMDGLLVFELGDSEELEFELAVRAVDLNGNIGPPTYAQVVQSSATGGCASHHAGRAVSFGMITIVLALLVGRRRR